jgi:hypothetical protein
MKGWSAAASRRSILELAGPRTRFSPLPSSASGGQREIQIGHDAGWGSTYLGPAISAVGSQSLAWGNSEGGAMPRTPCGLVDLNLVGRASLDLATLG